MKNTRKKLLVSSVAALLVSAMALSTATFAWFTQNTEATADGVYVKTVKASNLEISSKELDWGTLVDYGYGESDSVKSMLPASSSDGTNWFKAVAAASTASTAKDDSYSAITANKESYVLLDELNFHNAGETSINDVKVTITGLQDYARVALVPISEHEASIDAATFRSNVYDTEADVYQPVVDANGPDENVTITSKSNLTIDIDSVLTANEYKYYALCIWFEGQDEDCYDNTVGQTLNNLTFSVTGTPAV